MYDKQIILAPDKPNLPLSPVWSMRYSAGRMTFTGMPAAMTSAVLVLVLAGAATPLVLSIALDAAPPEIIIEAGAMTAVGQGDYYVYGFDATARPFGLGKGLITIESAPTLEAISGVTPVGNVLPVFAPATGDYYLLTAELNADGEPVVKLTAQED